MDGEAVVVGADGVAVFDALHRRHRASDALLYAFDLPELDGEDLRPLPLAERKAKLVRLLARVVAGIAFNEHTDEDGATAGTPARGASKASYRSGLPCPTSPDRRGTGSRSRTRTAPR